MLAEPVYENTSNSFISLEFVDMLEEPMLEEPMLEESAYEWIKVKASHYNPSLGGTNCSAFYYGECHSRMASGERWQDWFNKGAIACPIEFPFWTQIVVNGITYTCLDRGSAIVLEDGYYWIDILTDTAPFKFGTILDAYVK